MQTSILLFGREVGMRWRACLYHMAADGSTWRHSNSVWFSYIFWWKWRNWRITLNTVWISMRKTQNTAATVQVPAIEGKRSARWLCSNWCPAPLSKSTRAVPLNSLDKIRSSQRAAANFSWVMWIHPDQLLPTPGIQTFQSFNRCPNWHDFCWVFLQCFRGRESVNHASIQHRCYAWPPQKSKS